MGEQHVPDEQVPDGPANQLEDDEGPGAGDRGSATLTAVPLLMEHSA